MASELAPATRIVNQLTRTRRQIKLADLATRLLLGLLAAVLFLMAAVAIDHWVVDLGVFGRWTLLAAFTGGALWYVVRHVALHAIRAINPVYAARLIERAEPSLRNSLINYLLLRQQPAGVHESVLRTIEQRAAADVDEFDTAVAVDYSPAIKLGYLLAALSVFIGAYKILSPKDPLPSVKRLFAPWAAIDRPARVRIMEVTPGDATAFLGDIVTVNARLEGAHSSDAVELVFTTEDGQTVERRVPMEAASDRLTWSAKLPPEEGGLRQSLIYRLEAGDATSPTFRLTATAAPRILVDRVEYIYPGYMNRPRRIVDRQGDLSGWEGTQVTLTAVANQPIRAAWIEFDPASDGGPPTPADRVLHLQVDGTTARQTFPLELAPDRSAPKYASYIVRFETPAGRRSSTPILHQIEVLPDVPPEVEILTPNTTRVQVPEDGQLPLEIRAVDPDFGLAQLAVDVRGQRPQTAFQHPLFTDSAGLAGPVQRAWNFVPSEHGCRAGDLLRFVAVARDNRPDPSPTKPTAVAAIPPTTPSVGESRSRELIVEILPAEKKPGSADRAPNSKPEKPSENPPPKPDSEKNGAPSPKPSNERPPQDPSAESKPDRSKPASSKPDDSKPDSAKPDGSKPDSSKPDDSKPDSSKPDSSKPDDSKPDSDRPADTQPPASKPQNDNSNAKEPENTKSPQNGGNSPDNAASKTESGENSNPSKQSGGKPGKQTGKPMGGQPGEQAGEQTGEQSAGDQSAGDPSGSPPSGSPPSGNTPTRNTGNQKSDGKQPGSKPSGSKQPGSKPSGSDPSGSEPSADDQSGGEPSSDQQTSGQQTNGQQTSDKQTSGKQTAGKQPNDKQIAGKPSRGKQEGSQSKGNQPQSGQPQSGSEAGDEGGEGGDEKPSDAPMGQAPAGGKSKPAEDDGEAFERALEFLQKQAGKGREQTDSPNRAPDPSQPTTGAAQQPTGGTPSQSALNNARKSESGQPPDGEKPGEKQGEKSGEKQGEKPGERPGTDSQGSPGQSGAGQASKDQAAPPDPAKQNADRNKQMAPDNREPSDASDPPAPSQSKRQSDSQGGADGDRSGGGKRGGGQGAKQAGNDTAGSTSAGDDGAGQAAEKGQGETSGRAGDQARGKAPDQPGNASDTPPSRAPMSGSEQGPGAQKVPGNANYGGPNPNSLKPGDERMTGGGGVAGNPPAGRKPPDGPVADGDAANLDYANRATDLVLEYLKDQKDAPDEQLLEELGWSVDDLRKFISRWEALKRAANEPDPATRRELSDSLRSLGLRPATDRRRSVNATNDAFRGNRDAGGRSNPPAKYQERFNAYRRGAGQ